MRFDKSKTPKNAHQMLIFFVVNSTFLISQTIVYDNSNNIDSTIVAANHNSPKKTAFLLVDSSITFCFFLIYLKQMNNDKEN